MKIVFDLILSTFWTLLEFCKIAEPIPYLLIALSYSQTKNYELSVQVFAQLDNGWHVISVIKTASREMFTVTVSPVYK